MGRVGRPPSIDAPPCPQCETTENVATHGIRDVDGQPRRSFRCDACEHVFVPGFDDQQPTQALKGAVRLVREETEAPYRLIANAITRHLGIDVSHTTVRGWCQQDSDTPAKKDDALACEHLSILWALRHEIKDEARAKSDA